MLVIVFAGAFAACNGNQTTDDRPAPVDGVAEPVPTPPPGDVQEITEDVNGTDAFLSEYMEVKNALVEDDHEKAKEEANDMLEEFNQLDEGVVAQQQKQQIETSIQQVANANNIGAQRDAFAQLSNQLYQVAQQDDLTNKTLYWQHCPMAMNNKGANWLSFDKEIQNPFMGQNMPKCGSVQETL